MAAFTYTFSDPVLTIRMTGGSWGTYYRFFVRYAEDPSSSVYLQDHYCPQSGVLTVDITLSPNRSYVFNAGEHTGSSTIWYWSSGPTVTTGSGIDPPISTRPNNWYWRSIVQSGMPVAISADEWNAFCARIDEFRIYKGLYAYGFTTVYSGTPVAAWIANQARNAIYDLAPWQTPGNVNKGDTITAAFFLALQNALNAVS